MVLVLIAVVGVTPLLQVGLAHLQNTNPYPLTTGPDFGPEAIATGEVEDVMVIIVDGYPNLRTAEDWFGHDTVPLTERLSSLGFEVAREAWSQHTFTAPSVSALLELRPVIDAVPVGSAANLSSLYAITRGDNFVSRWLKAAGFTYTHFDSGWDVTACGEMVDRCVGSPWIDETIGGLIDSSALGGWLQRRLGSYTLAATMNTANGLLQLGHELSQNGSHDYIFAHLLLPHDPPVVNETCQFDEARVRDDQLYLGGSVSTHDRRQAISDQMTCVDSLLSQIAGVPGPSTAVLITADHGTGTGGQVPRQVSEWTDADVAERFGILLAYRLPPSCGQPRDVVNTLVMRAIMDCAVTVDLPEEKPGHLIGLANTEWVEPTRMQEIRARLGRGVLETSLENQ
ncbi:MAG: sulfatase-like hydrolase/transferase [Acidimicrobiia bacterium]